MIKQIKNTLVMETLLTSPLVQEELASLKENYLKAKGTAEEHDFLVYLEEMLGFENLTLFIETL